MQEHLVKVWKSNEKHPREEELAYKIAAMAADEVDTLPEVEAMVIDRLIDNYGVAIASLDRHPVEIARAQALAHPSSRRGGALMGIQGTRYHPAWAGWANAVAVRELDFHDNIFGTESGHPGDAIAPILAVAQHMGVSGKDLIRGIATSYEVQVNLCKSINLNRHQIDHVGHLAPGVAAGIGAMLRLDVDTIYQALQQTIHTSYATRQLRRGMMSSWKCYACAHVGKIAVEAIDRALRGGNAPSPIYEGEVSVIATMLGGPEAEYRVSLPEPGEPKRAMLDTFTKEHSAAYHGQSIIDLAFRIRDQVPDTGKITKAIYHTKHLGHHVMGTGSNDSQKFDPTASRETLDHSLMFLFAVALQDGEWHHEKSYAPERVQRPDTVALWRKISTNECPEWNRRYDDYPHRERAHGGRIEIHFEDGSVMNEEIHAANAHPAGARPFLRKDYIRKFSGLVEGRLIGGEAARFLERVQTLPEVAAGGLDAINVQATEDCLRGVENLPEGLF